MWLAERRFWSQVSGRSLAAFYLGVAATFSSLGFLLDMRLLGRHPTPELAVDVLTAAGFSVVYAHLGARRPRWLALAVPVHVAVAVFSHRLFPDLPPLTGEGLEERLSLDLFAATIGIAAGYCFFVYFIVTVGSRHFRARAEIALAQELHADLVPALDLLAGGWRVCGRSDPATEVGGDLVDALVVEGDVCALVADVTGHGVRAGTLMGMFKAAARMALRTEREVAALLASLNEVLLPLKSSSLFVTAACLKLREGGLVEYGLAGHPPILLREARTGAVRRLSEGGIPVGLLGETPFGSVSLRLEPGDALAVVTDGLIEAEDESGNELGLAGLEAALAAPGPAAPDRILDALLEAARRHGRQADDQSVLVVEYRGT